MNKQTEDKILSEIEALGDKKNPRALKKIFDDNKISQEDRQTFRMKHRPLVSVEKAKENAASVFSEMSDDALLRTEARLEKLLAMTTIRIEKVREEKVKRSL